MRRHLLIVLCLIAALSLSAGVAHSQNAGGGLDAPDPDQPVGLTVNTGEAAEGYILVPVIQTKETLLISNDGRIVHTWPSDYYPSASVYLKDNGNLLRTAGLDVVPYASRATGQFGFISGRLEELNWEGEVVWSWEYTDERILGHHDIELLPNGNILVLAFDRYFEDELLAAGRDPELIPEPGELWSEMLMEVDPTTNEIVWEWRVWDHLIQDVNPDAANYGDVAANPGKIDINYTDIDAGQGDDWLHMNAVDYNPDRDEIMLSVRNWNEIWILDHGLSTEEAKGEAGDLLYRWGNPESHRAGDDQDQRLFGQHDSQWIAEGLPGAGNVLVFDNGDVERPYSRVVEIDIPIDENGNYTMITDARLPHGKPEIVWQYSSVPPFDFYSRIISGMQRQPNGNTLIAEGARSRIFEVTPDNEIVWEYYLPHFTWLFRAERYNLPVFEEHDLSGDIPFPGGAIWGKDCVDGLRPRLHEWSLQEQPDMVAFLETHGDAAQGQWELEACAEHGGIAQ